MFRGSSLKKEIIAILAIKLALIFTIKALFFSDAVNVEQGQTAIDNQLLGSSNHQSKEADNDQ